MPSGQYTWGPLWYAAQEGVQCPVAPDFSQSVSR